METIMETVLNKIFASCDPNDSGTTSVSKIIDCITPFMQSNLGTGISDTSRLEYRICQLMVSFRLDSETVAGRCSAQAQARDRLDSHLVDSMRSMMRMIEDTMEARDVCASAGTGNVVQGGKGEMLRDMQRKEIFYH